MKKGKFISATIVMSALLSTISSPALADNIAGGSGAMAAAVDQANDAEDYAVSMITNITTEYNATGRITSGHSNVAKNAGAVSYARNNARGVIVIKYRDRDISGALQGVTLVFTPHHAGRPLKIGDINIDDWTCTYKPTRVYGQKQYGVLHNIFVYAKYPLSVCQRVGYRQPPYQQDRPRDQDYGKGNGQEPSRG